MSLLGSYFPDIYQSDSSAVLFRKSEKSSSKITHKIHDETNLTASKTMGLKFL